MQRALRALALRARFAHGKVASCYFSRTPAFGVGVFFALRELPIKKPTAYAMSFFIGDPGEIRTPDQLVRSQLLYPTELRSHEANYYTNFTP